MRKRYNSFWVLALAVVMTLGLLSGCGESSSTADEGGTAPEQVSSEDGSAAPAESGTDEAEEGETAEAGPSIEATIASYQEIVAEFEKGADADLAKVAAAYEESLQPLVERRSADVDQQLTAAIEAARAGDLDVAIAGELVDKLMQKIFFDSIRAELREVSEAWGDKAEGMEEIEEAEASYAALAGMVERRGEESGDPLASRIEGAFGEMAGAVESGSELDFHLARQVLDKTLMKAFYLSVLHELEEIEEEPEAARKEQAEAWAYYQALHGYLEGSAAEDANYIQTQLNLETDVTTLDLEELKNRFVKGFIAVAEHEYEESFESWGEDRAAITALEGALFIDMVGGELRERLGDAGYQNLTADAEALLEAVKGGDREAAEAKHEAIVATLQGAIAP